MNSQKVEFIMCLVFGLTLHPLYQYFIPLDTKHQILNTLVDKSFFDLLRDCQYSIENIQSFASCFGSSLQLK